MKVEDEWIVTKSDASVLAMRCPDEYVNVIDDDIVVWVDPLDGTSEYTQGKLIPNHSIIISCLF